jgi:two-component system sensor histidine kinase AtoS
VSSLLQKRLEKTQQELEISQDQLMRAETNFKSLINLIADPVVIVDHKGNFLEINDKLEELIGVSKEGLLGKSFLKTDLITKESKSILTEKLAERMMGNNVKPYEIQVSAKSGNTIYLEVNAKTIEHNGKRADLVIFRDITERKKIEEKLVKSERLAAIGEAATMVGHDLRNPLQAIENGIYYLDIELSNFPVSKKITETLETVHKSIDYADNIVSDLQSFASTRTPAFMDTNINELVEDTLQYAKKPKNIETVIELGQIPKIEADRDMVKRIFVNLAINGIQAMKENGGTLNVSTKKTKNFVEITFKDTGIGIKKENLEKIFTPFFTTKAQGMGIGLTICKRLVEFHDGSIIVDSEEGEGATFTVYLPIQRNGGGKLD